MSTNYFIAATYRSGSTFLGETLAATGLAGDPKEFFHRLNMTDLARQNYVEFIRQTIRDTATPNGVFGAKLLWHHVAYIREHVQQFPPFDAPKMTARDTLDILFDHPKYLYITRNDKLGQAISYVKARQTGVFHEYDNQSSPNPVAEPVYNQQAIREALLKMNLDDMAWRAYFQATSIVPYTVVYEDFRARRDVIAREIAGFLGIAMQPDFVLPPPPLKPTSNGINKEWRKRFLEENATSFSTQ